MITTDNDGMTIVKTLYEWYYITDDHTTAANSSMSEAGNNLVIYRVDQQNCKTWRVLETLKIKLNLLQIPLPPPCGEHGINSRLNGYLVIISMNQYNFMSHALC